MGGAVYVASANQLGEYFDVLVGVYCPDGSRAPDFGKGRYIKRSSALPLKPNASTLWKSNYGNPLF